MWIVSFAFYLALMAQNTNSNEVFGMLTQEDKLDGTNYSLWSFTVRNLLVAKGLWDYVTSDEERPGNVALDKPPQGLARGRGQAKVAAPAAPTVKQKRWSSHDAQALLVISLSIKRSMVPHIQSCKTSKAAWDVLENMFAGKNEAKLSFLKKVESYLYAGG